MSPIAELKSRLSLRSVARDVGIELPCDGKKFSSPFRPDNNPSCSVKGDVIRDWTTGETLDVISFFASAKHITTGDAIRELNRIYPGQASVFFPRARKTRPQASVKAETMSTDATFGWPPLERGSELDILRLSKLRDISEESLREMARRGLLWFADFDAGRAFVVTDSSRRNAQARLLSGEKWPNIDATSRSPKAETGASHGWPIGLADAVQFNSIALTEGVPDFLSVLHHAAASGGMDLVAPVMMPGAGVRIVPEALPLFKGKRVRIFVHNDAGAGNRAYKDWAAQLEDAGATVDGFEFSNLVQSTGAAVKDLNDLCRLDVDSWEENFDAIEVGMFNFVTKGER